MKANFYLALLLFSVIGLSTLPVHAQKYPRRDMQAFEHLAVTLSAGTTGIGLQAATPIHRNFALRGGFSTLPGDFNYTYDGTGDNGDAFSVDMKAQSKMTNGNLLVDFFPRKDSRFHLSAGVIFGSARLLKVTGHTDYDEPIEIGDVWIRPDNLGNVAAWIETNNIKPYVGLGFGRTIPRRRFGFKFELGGIFQGSPKIKTDNPIINDELLQNQSELDDVNKFLKDYFKVYPVLSFELTYRIF